MITIFLFLNHLESYFIVLFISMHSFQIANVCCLIWVPCQYVWLYCLASVEAEFHDQYEFGCICIVVSCIIESLAETLVIVANVLCFVKMATCSRYIAHICSFNIVSSDICLWHYTSV